MVEDRQSLVPALETPADPMARLMREAIRDVLETAVAEEVTAALGRGAWERVAQRRGYRHGTSARTVVTGEGPVTVRRPRARLHTPDGTSREFQNRVLPKYARRRERVDAILAQLLTTDGPLSSRWRGRGSERLASGALARPPS